MPSSSRTLTPWPSCFVCGTTDDLLECASCKVVHYCGEEHQKLDWGNHKSLCKVICQERKKIIRQQERTQRSNSGDMFRAGPAFALARVPTTTALQQAKQEIEKYLVWSRRNRAPKDQALCILAIVEFRLGNNDAHLEAMDEWWNQEWHHFAVPLWGAYETSYQPDDNWHIEYCTEFCYCGAASNMFTYSVCKLLQLLKSRCAFQAMEGTNLLRPKLPAELVDLIKAECASNSEFNDPSLRQHINTGRSTAFLVQVIEELCVHLVTELDKSNVCFWPLFSNPNKYLHQDYHMGRFNALEDALFAFITTYDAFAEIPGAVDWVLSQLHGRFDAGEVARRMQAGIKRNSCADCDPFPSVNGWF